MPSEINLTETLKNSFDYFMEDVHTCIPARVVAIRNYNEGLVDVKPLVSMVTTDNKVLERAVILGVPYIFPATSSSALIMPVKVGDTCWLMFSMRAIESFKQGNGYPTRPLNLSRFSSKDAVAILGLFPQKANPNDKAKHTNPHSHNDTVLVHNYGKSDEVEIRMKDGGGVVVNCKSVVINSDEAEVNTSDLTVNATSSTWNGDITLNGNLDQTGTHTLDGITMNTHKHNITGIQTGGSTILSQVPQ